MPAPRPSVRSLEDVRYDELKRILDENEGSVARAAVVFGVHRSTIYRWLRSRGEIVHGSSDSSR